MKSLHRVLAALLLLTPLAAFAAVPHEFSVQGVLRDNGGKLQSMAVTVNVRLFDAEVGGTLLSSAPGISTVAENGLFTVNVADANLPAALLSPLEVWLELKVGPDTFPRQRATSQLFALVCGSAETLGGHPAGDYLLSSTAATTYQQKTAAAVDSAKFNGLSPAQWTPVFRQTDNSGTNCFQLPQKISGFVPLPGATLTVSAPSAGGFWMIQLSGQVAGGYDDGDFFQLGLEDHTSGYSNVSNVPFQLSPATSNSFATFYTDVAIRYTAVPVHFTLLEANTISGPHEFRVVSASLSGKQALCALISAIWFPGTPG